MLRDQTPESWEEKVAEWGKVVSRIETVTAMASAQDGAIVAEFNMHCVP